MTTSSNADRFTGLADIYASHRPAYPADVIGHLAKCANISGAPKIAIDIGCGTGISTLALAIALSDWSIIAAEPNAGMLAKARLTCANHSNIGFSINSAEALPAESASVGLVLAAQAIHWFDAPKFFSEAARVLAPGGTLAILYNNRQNVISTVLSEIEDYLESVDDTYNRNYRDRNFPALLGDLESFDNATHYRRVWLKPTTTDDLVNYFMSRSMLQPLVAKVGVSKLRHRIGDIADEHARAGILDIPFATELDMAIRK